jgi:hypothetical protein
MEERRNNLVIIYKKWFNFTQKWLKTTKIKIKIVKIVIQDSFKAELQHQYLNYVSLINKKYQIIF